MLNTAASWMPLPTVVLVVCCVLPQVRYLVLLAGLLAALRTTTDRTRAEMFTHFSSVFRRSARSRTGPRESGR